MLDMFQQGGVESPVNLTWASREAGSKDLFGEWQTQPHEPTKG